MLEFDALIQAINSQNGQALFGLLAAVDNAISIGRSLKIKSIFESWSNSANAGAEIAQSNQVMSEEVKSRFEGIDNRINDIEDVIVELYKDYLKRRLVHIVQDEENLQIVKTALLEVEQRNGCIMNSNVVQNEFPRDDRRVFVYLASKNYAGMQSTLDIAIKYQFIWRKYFRNNNNGTVNRVDQIRTGDVIVLAYRVPGSRFRVLSPTVVRPEVDGLGLIGGGLLPPNTPFRCVNEQGLINRLLVEGYQLDQTIGQQVGLPVCMLATDFENSQVQQIYNASWPSPGQDTVYELNSVNPNGALYINDPTFRTWLQTLV